MHSLDFPLLKWRIYVNVLPSLFHIVYVSTRICIACLYTFCFIAFYQLQFSFFHFSFLFHEICNKMHFFFVKSWIIVEKGVFWLFSLFMKKKVNTEGHGYCHILINWKVVDLNKYNIQNHHIYKYILCYDIQPFEFKL